jgi:adenosylmethionine-8-amino-7-oxononanoate aminotransferase
MASADPHTHDELQRLARQHLLLHFSRNGAFATDRGELLVLDRGEGPYVFDTHGNRYIDALSSLFCAQIGYSYGAAMAEAASAQLERLAFNTNWSTAHPAAIELAAKLASLAPPGIEKVFLTSGGSEAVESAWKLVRQYHIANGEPARRKAIARRWAYHGASLGALAFTSVESYKEPFQPQAIPVARVSHTGSFRRPSQPESEFVTELLEEIESTIVSEGPDTVAMLIAEPVQNAGGCITPPSGYWEGLRQLADRYGIVLVADEVITGFGRIGEWFAVTRFGGKPDLITLAKGITSAYAPMGAVLVSERVAAPFYDDPKRILLHGITFGGHPLAAAIALKNIEIFETEGVLENVRTLEPLLAAKLEELKELPIVGDVRGAGFFWAIELVKDAANAPWDADERERLLREYLPQRLREAGLIARTDDRGDSVLHIAPPLISSAPLLEEIVERLASVLRDAGTQMGLEAATPAGVESR